MAEQRDLTTPPADDLTTELTTPLAAASDRCPNCGSRMAPDQRYCVECGERRTGGGLRDALPRTQTTAAAAAPPRRPRMSANSSLIAGIATLLLAMGVGVLIGRSGDHVNSKAAGAPVQVVTVPAGGAAATGAAASTGTKSASTTSKSKKSKKSKTSATQQTAAKAKVKLPPPVVKVGGKCTKGTKGCQGDKFTGAFFGQ